MEAILGFGLPFFHPLMSQEIWQIITEYPFYEISNYGRVRLASTSEIILTKRHTRKKSPLTIMLTRGLPHPKRVKLHRLVAKYFVPNPENLPLVVFKDLDYTNLRADNLQWANRSIAMVNGHKNRVCREDVPFKNSKHQEIIDLYMKEGLSQSQISAKISLHQTRVSTLIRRYTKKIKD